MNKRRIRTCVLGGGGFLLVIGIIVTMYRPYKSVITFIFDDGVKEDSKIVELFDKHSLKCGFALISWLSEEDYLRYLEYQNNGYEILAHSTDGEPMVTDIFSETDVAYKLSESKKILTEWDMNITGWVSPSSVLNEKYIGLLKKDYNFGYTKYYGTYEISDTLRPYNLLNDDPYRLWRIDLYNSLEDLEHAIDLTYENNGMLTLYFHSYDLNSDQIKKIEELLEYIKQKQIKVLPPNAAFEYYYGDHWLSI